MCYFSVRIIKVEVSVISQSQITLTEILIILDIINTESNNLFITGMHCFTENNDKHIIAVNTVYFDKP